MSAAYRKLSLSTLKRLPNYLNYLKTLPEDGRANISATAIADALGLNQVQVRKDLASVCAAGRPKVGFLICELVSDIEHALGYDDMDSAVIVGTGRLGTALLSYEGFHEYGLDIVAAFDENTALAGTRVNGKPIFGMEKMQDLCSRLKVHLGIITVPAQHAQSVCDALTACGVRAIWNFAPTHLVVPEGVIVRSENLAANLAALSRQLAQHMVE